MSATATLVDVAQEKVEREWARVAAQAEVIPSGSFPTRRLIEDLLAVLEEKHDTPIEQLEPLFQRMLLDRYFVDDNGDSVTLDNVLEEVELQVQAVIAGMIKVRHIARRRGEWSDAPVTPQMFG